MTADELAHADELICFCGKPKQMATLFCFTCYEAIPARLRRFLYRDGAYTAARELLIEEKGTVTHAAN